MKSTETAASADAPSVTLADVQRAAATVKGAVINTDFDVSRTLGEMFDCDVWLKFENLQFTAAYKERGALNKLASLSEKERACGVIAMSAGNHAQGVAYHARRLNIPATIVMPSATPTVKVENTRKLGAKVILDGASFEDASAFAMTYGTMHGLTFIHPFDDPHVIAGQGTVALEMLEAVPDLDTLIVPIGGGGLISGVATVAKAINPKIRIIGVEAQLYPSMLNAIKHSHLPVGGDTLAEGIAVTTPGRITRPIIEKLVDDIVLVSEADLERAITLLITIEKTVVEGAGAAGLAAMMMDPRRYKGHKVGLILCGGNIDTRLLASVLTRDLAREGRLSRLAIDVPDRPGQLAKIASVIGGASANIVEVYHQRVFTDVPAKGTELHLVVETRDRDHIEAVVEELRKAGYSVTIKGSGGGPR
ncbi:MAG: threonine ammonia-lyase [Hyphomicrobium sp.]|nr:threonine ammonia-lyase [Hyphomicrobium sp.]